jgi:SAM-dependent methyltransferase
VLEDAADHELASPSAQAMLPHVLDLVPEAASVVDVGCGTGAWLAECKRLGITDVLGIDRLGADLPLQVEPCEVVNHDLTTPIVLRRRFDLVLCLEVGEHLPAAAAEGLVSSITRLGDVVVFSAAIPDQGGPGHVNLQWPRYWANLFAAVGFGADDCLRPQLWDDHRIAYWYRQNVVVYRKGHVADRPPLAIVHPELVEWLRRMSPAPWNLADLCR